MAMSKQPTTVEYYIHDSISMKGFQILLLALAGIYSKITSKQNKTSTFHGSFSNTTLQLPGIPQSSRVQFLVASSEILFCPSATGNQSANRLFFGFLRNSIIGPHFSQKQATGILIRYRKNYVILQNSPSTKGISYIKSTSKMYQYLS